jgi:hypothetical protein
LPPSFLEFRRQINPLDKYCLAIFSAVIWRGEVPVGGGHLRKESRIRLFAAVISLRQ